MIPRPILPPYRVSSGGFDCFVRRAETLVLAGVEMRGEPAPDGTHRVAVPASFVKRFAGREIPWSVRAGRFVVADGRVHVDLAFREEDAFVDPFARRSGKRTVKVERDGVAAWCTRRNAA